jgi:hypothetical protein
MQMINKHVAKDEYKFKKYMKRVLCAAGQQEVRAAGGGGGGGHCGRVGRAGPHSQQAGL